MHTQLGLQIKAGPSLAVLCEEGLVGLVRHKTLSQASPRQAFECTEIPCLTPAGENAGPQFPRLAVRQRRPLTGAFYDTVGGSVNEGEPCCLMCFKNAFALGIGQICERSALAETG